VNSSLIVEALLIKHPGEVKAVQRRSNYRVRVGPDSELTVRIWRIADAADLRHIPVAAQKIEAGLRDISIGGMGMIVPKGDVPLKLLVDERLRIEFTNPEQSLILEGRVRYLPAPNPDGTTRVGVQFKKLEDDMNGRQILAELTRIVGLLQREEVRRMRLGLAQAG
jgi:c-di-GMP-binding flagellar brake protein YcgR